MLAPRAVTPPEPPDMAALRAIGESEGTPWHKRTIAWLELARLASVRGRPFFEYKQRAAECELRDYWSQGLRRVRVISRPDACPRCAELDGKVFQIRALLKRPLLPCADCSGTPDASGVGWCRCYYEVLFPGERA
ncbi:MAG: hypothetical protein AB7Q81_24585 [Gammaproteobacteria bacterium]